MKTHQMMITTNHQKNLKKQSINDITKDLIEQLKNNPTELFMTLPIEEPTPKKQNDMATITNND